MDDSLQSSYYREGSVRTSRPLSGSPVNTVGATSGSSRLNESLQTQHIDLSEKDNSFMANATRYISKIVGGICTPRQVLGLLRVLKAITLSFLLLTIISDLMYIVFAELASSKQVKIMAGGTRDVILRLYGILLCLLGLAIELDYSKIVKKFSGLKGFIPRALLYFFIAQITGSHPILLKGSTVYSSSSSNNNNGGGNDDAANGDDAAGDDDAAAAQAASSSYEYSNPEIDIPSSAVGFQRVTSFVLYVKVSVDCLPER
jgi:hypothetical protein